MYMQWFRKMWLSVQYRAEIDGLRALAVLSVLLFHAGFDFIPGGFLGVDVFFVISGFLITSIIRREINENQFSLLHFYERRARRILPALFAMCFGSFVLGWHILLPNAFKNFAQDLISINLFVSNIHFWLKSADYFAPAVELSPLLHSWSLSVEEQFYVFFPLLMLLFKRVRRGYGIWVIAGLSAISFALTQLNLSNDPNAAFYLTPTRTWELGIGCLIAHIPRNGKVHGSRIIAELGTGLGISGLVISFLFFSEETRHPGYSTLLPVMGTAFIILFIRPGLTATNILSIAPLRAVGLISYSLYLWHQPVFAFARVQHAAPLDITQKIVLLLLSFSLAFISWRWVEKPFRKSDFLNRKTLISISGITAACSIALAFLVLVNDGIYQRLTPNAQMVLRYGEKDVSFWNKCNGKRENLISPTNACQFLQEKPANIAIWGDSHSTAIAQAFGSLAAEKGENTIEFSFSDCRPSDFPAMDKRLSECQRFNQTTLNWLLDAKDVQSVIIAARWVLTYPSSGHEEKGKKSIRVLKKNIENLIAKGKRVALIYSIPETEVDVLQILTHKAQYGLIVPKHMTTSFDHFKEKTNTAHIVLDAIGTFPGLLRIYPEDVFCNSMIEGTCIVSEGLRPYYFDHDHLNRIGAQKLAEHIWAELALHEFSETAGQHTQLDFEAHSSFNE